MEKNRLRRCRIYYFLEDDSMMVVEPEKPNSGIPQGTIIQCLFSKSIDGVIAKFKNKSWGKSKRWEHSMQ